jgi:hypothetical protein
MVVSSFELKKRPCARFVPPAAERETPTAEEAR